MSPEVGKQADLLLSKYGKNGRPFKCAVWLSPHRDLVVALIERGVTSVRIREIMFKEYQEDLPHQSIQRHGRQACACPR